MALAVTGDTGDTDDVAVTGWYVSESSSTPALGAFATTRPTSFNMSSGDGIKTVYAWTRDGAGNVSGRGSDTIVLDTTAPAKTGESLSVLISAGDSGTGTMTFSENVTVVSYRMITNGTSVLNTASAAGNVVTFTFDTGDLFESNSIEVVVRDAAGNEATVQSATYIIGQ